MTTQIYLSTTGSVSPVEIFDLGAIRFTHPTVDRELLQPAGEFSTLDIIQSTDLIAKVIAGEITLKDSNNNAIITANDLNAASTLGPATASTLGSTKIATQLEVDTGTNAFSYVTPKTLKDYVKTHDAVTVSDSSLEISGQALNVNLDTTSGGGNNAIVLVAGEGLYVDPTAISGATNLSIANHTSTTLDIASSTGTDATIPAATTLLAGLLTASDKTKLDGIESGATADQLASEVPYSNTTSGLVATNVQTAIDELDSSIDGIIADYGTPNGLATLDWSGKIPSSQIPALAITDVFVVADIPARDALTNVQTGDVAKVLDNGSGFPATYIYNGTSWILIEDGGDVYSVNGQTGVVVLGASDIGYVNTTSGLTASNVQTAIDEVEGRLDTAQSNITSLQSLSHAPVTAADNSILVAGQAINVKIATGTNALSLQPTGLYVAPAITTANLSLGAVTSTTVEIAIDTGTDAIIPSATPSLAGVLSAADKTKLDGIESGATADQLASEVPYSNTISGLVATNVQTAIDELDSFSHSPVSLGGVANDTTNDTLTLLGQTLTVNLVTTTTDGAMSAADKLKLNGIENGATADQLASEVPYSNTTSGLAATNVQTAIDEIVSYAKREKTYFAGRNANLGTTAAQDLRREDSIATNLSPYGMEFDGKFTQIVLSSTNTANYTVSILKNDVSIGSYTRTNGSTVQVIDIGSPPTAAKGDRIRIRYVSGAATIERPTVQLTYVQL